MNESNVYCVFLLRLWREHDGSAGKSTPLRILLEAPHSGERHSFADFESLVDFLVSRLEQKKKE